MAGYAVFLLFRRLTRLVLSDPRPAPSRSGFGPALAVAALFTLHPVQVYAVADPGQMELLLATLFSLLMLLAYLEALVRSSPGLLAASALLYLLAVLSKENVITMPAVALAATFLARRPSWALIRRLWPYYGLCAAVAVWVVVRELGQHQGIHGLGAVRATPGLDPAWRALDPSHLHLRSVITQGYLFFRYLLLWLIPNVGWMSIDLQYPLAPALASWPES